MSAIKLTDSRTSRSIGYTWTVEAPRCHTLIRQFARPARPFVHRKAVSTHTHVGACYKVSPCDFVACACVDGRGGVLQSRMRFRSMRLCRKLLGGRGLTRAAFYQISTDSVLAQSHSGSWASCLASLRPFIDILRSLVTAWCFASVLSAGCVLYLRESAVFLFPARILTASQNFFGDDLTSCRNSSISCGICESSQ